MIHNFSIEYSVGIENDVFEVQANSLEDAMIKLYEMNEDAVYIDHDVDINPAAYESESDTIQQAILQRQK